MIAKFYRALGYYHANRDNNSKGVECLEKALSFARLAEDINEQARTVNMLAAAKWPMGEYLAGRTLAIEGQRLTQISTNLPEEGNALWIEAGFCMKLGNYNHALLLLQRAKECLRLCGLSGGHLDNGILSTEASTYMEKAEYAEARSIYAEIRQNTSPDQDMFRHAYALLSLGRIDIELGLIGNEVEYNLESAKMLMNSIGYVTGVKYCEMSQANLMLYKEEFLAAKTLFQQCLKWSWEKDAQVSSYCLENMANVSCWRAADFDWTSAYAMVYLLFAKKSQDKCAVHKALRSLGDVFMFYGDEETAINLFLVALEGFTSMDVHRSRADCMLRIGDIMKKRGDEVKAKSFWMEARPLFERSLQARNVAQVDSRLAEGH